MIKTKVKLEVTCIVSHDSDYSLRACITELMDDLIAYGIHVTGDDSNYSSETKEVREIVEHPK